MATIVMDQGGWWYKDAPKNWWGNREDGTVGPLDKLQPNDTLVYPSDMQIIDADKQKMVEAFMKAADQVIGDRPGLRDQLLRIRLITEEANETAAAIYQGDIIKAIDGMCDALYVIYGTAVACGIDLNPFFAEVHRSNMAKVDEETGKVVKDAFGKVVKPEGWTPPDLEGVFKYIYGDPANFAPAVQSHDDKWHRLIAQLEVDGYTPESVTHELNGCGHRLEY